jgi:uncharacterized protein
MSRFFEKNSFCKITLIGLILWLPMQLAAQDESIYYKVIHPETKAESYLLGTFHTYPEGWYEVPREVKEAMAKSTRLITEIGIPSNSRFSRKSLRATTYRPGKTVLDKLKGSTKENFQEYFDENIGGSKAAKYRALNRKPYFMYGQLFPLRFSDSVMSMERELEALASKNEIPVLGLEPNEKRILRYYRKYARSRKHYNLDLIAEIQLRGSAKLFFEYLNGDIIGMKKVAGGASKMAIERNIYWTPQLVELLKEPSLVAVGTGHLIGNIGVNELLKKEGFSVEPIPLSHPLPQDLLDYLEENKDK